MTHDATNCSSTRFQSAFSFCCSRLEVSHSLIRIAFMEYQSYSYVEVKDVVMVLHTPNGAVIDFLPGTVCCTTISSTTVLYRIGLMFSRLFRSSIFNRYLSNQLDCNGPVCNAQYVCLGVHAYAMVVLSAAP